MQKKNLKKLVLFVELNEREREEFLSVKKKVGARSNTETVRVLIKRAMEGLT